jgi:Tfp pilus assembly protein PilF/predicted Ser/Thr protein kinase
MPRDTLAHYRIIGKIGAGGMGVVYRAQDTKLGREVALKVVSEQAGAGDNAHERLLREARMASALNHPNICTIYEASVADGETYIAMELVEGRPLSELISEGALSMERAIRFTSQIAEALAHAHKRGVVHRDLKSANVVITPEGRAKVLDFGLARRPGAAGPDDATRTSDTLTKEGAVAGTLAYMAPETLRGEAADNRSDLWALGVILYESVTGRLPFGGSTSFEISSAILRDSPLPLPSNVPPALSGIIQRLLAKPAGERYQAAAEVLAALELIQPATTSSHAIAAQPARRKWKWTAAGLAIVAAVAVFAFMPKRHATPAARTGRLSDGNRASANAEANEYYERAMVFIPRHDPPQVRHMLERALEIDPKFAAARGSHAFTHLLLLMQGDTNQTTSLYKAEEEARQALQDDPECSVAHSTLTGVYLAEGRKELVQGEFDMALKANDLDPAVRLWLPMYQSIMGRTPEAVAGAKEILSRWPMFWPARLNLGDFLLEQGDTAGAIREYERTLEQDARSRVTLGDLAHAHMVAGDVAKARTVLDRIPAEERRNYRLREIWALLLALEGKRAEALREMDEGLQTYAGAVYFGPLFAAEFYSVIGDRSTALDWLDRSVRMGDERDEWMRLDPLLANVRNEPKFQSMLASIGYRRQHAASGK